MHPWISRCYAFLLIFTLALSACAAPASAPATSTETPATSAEPAFPVTIEHKHGSTTITARPERVVSVGYRDHEHLLALGVKPVGVRDWYGNGYETIFWPWAQEALGDAQPEIVGDFGTINFERVAALDPDLIVGVYSGMSEDEYKTLSQIAPTLVQSGAYVDWGMPWQEESRMIGRALGQAEQAEALIAGVEAGFAAAKAAHPEFAGAQAVIGQLDTPGTYYVLGPQDHKARFFTMLGFEIPAEVAEVVGEQSNLQISQERLDLLDHDVLVWLVGSERGWADAPKMAEAVKNNPIYQQLNVVRAGRDLYPEEPADALAWSTPLSLFYALDHLVPMLAEALNGDAAASNTAPVAADAPCRTIVHDMGETEVCGTPQNVVALGPHMLDLMLSLGVQPAGFAETQYINEEAFGKPVEQIAFLGPWVETMPINVGDRADPNLEVLTLLDPDLILSELREEDQLALLQQIAPTIAFRGNRADEWQRTIGPIAQALNLSQEAERVIAEHEAFIAAKRAELAPLVAQHPRIMFVPQNQEGVLTIFTPNSWAGDLLVDLGFELVHLPGEETSVGASAEILPTLPADIILVGTSGTSTPELAKELWTKTAVLMALPASQAGRVHFVDYQLWSRLRGPIATRLVVEDLIERLAGE